MEQLKRIIRQHYEKIVLVLVLLLMGAAAVIIYGQSQEQRKKIREIPTELERRKVKGVKPVDLAPIEKAIEAAATPPAVVLSGSHNLFNPVRWVVQGGNQEPIKIATGGEIGPAKLVVEKIRPLNLTIAFEKAAVSGTGDQRIVNGYNTTVTNDVNRRRIPQFMSVNDTNKQIFVISEIKGPADAPTELAGKLKDFGGEAFTFAPGRPYVRVVGYEVDLKYSVNGNTFPRLRVGGSVSLEGDNYKIVDITESAVVLSDQSNGKRFTIGTSTPPQ